MDKVDFTSPATSQLFDYPHLELLLFLLDLDFLIADRELTLSLFQLCTQRHGAIALAFLEEYFICDEIWWVAVSSTPQYPSRKQVRHIDRDETSRLVLLNIQ